MTANSRTTTFTYDGDMGKAHLAGKDDGITITTYAGAGFEVAHVPAGRVAAGDTFADGSAGDWSPAGGTWLVESGAYSGQSSSGSWSLWTPTFQTGRIRARVQTQSWSGHALNAFLVFDFRDNDNYRYAGLMDDSDQWVIGEKRAGSLHTRASAAETINTGQWTTSSSSSRATPPA